MLKRKIVMMGFLTFGLIVALFIGVKTSGKYFQNGVSNTFSSVATAIGEYDPWRDLNDDGTIDIFDVVSIASVFGTSGTPINKTALILELQSTVQILEAKVESLEGGSTVLPDLCEKVKDSVVLIRGTTAQGTVQGSGFVYNFSETMFVITNYHVVEETTTISVTFANGNGYAAEVEGTDPYADLAVLSVAAPVEEFLPLGVASSSELRVGSSVVAIGNPFGLVNSMTVGVVSALGRTITYESGGYAIANVIQRSTPINPENSGGPLLDYYGNVVGITSAIISDSQGIGFAIPSNTILREIASLIENGTYESYSYLGISGIDMTYETAQELGADVTYGWRVVDVLSGGPADNAGVEVYDIIIDIEGSRVINGDNILSYLVENTLPGESVTVEVVRGSQTLEITIVLGKRPSP